MWKYTISEKNFARQIVSIFFQFFCRKMLITFSYIGTVVPLILFSNHGSQKFFIWIQVYALRRAFVNWRILDLTKFNLRANWGSCKVRHYRFVFFCFRCDDWGFLSHLQVSNNKSVIWRLLQTVWLFHTCLKFPISWENFQLCLISQLFSEVLQSVIAVA